MSKLRNLLILGTSLGLSCAVYAADEQKTAASTDKTTVTVPAQTGKEQVKEKVNINTATIEDLQKVKNIGKKKAKAIVDYRTANGEFKSLDDLLKVKCRGINKKWLDKVSSYLTM